MSAFDELKPYLVKARKLHYLSSILNYDLSTCTPIAALDEETELLLDQINEQARLYADPAFIALLKKVQEEEKDNQMLQKLCKSLLKESEFLARIDLKQYEAWNQAYQESTNAWRAARESGDYQTWLPAFKKCIAAKREWAKLKQDETTHTLYDACLESYEPGLREGDINRIFTPLKAFLLDNLPKVIAKQSKEPILKAHSEVEQEELAYRMLEHIHYDLSKGALRVSEHPFSDALSRNDARITTHYYEEDWRSSLYSVIHEGGHALEFMKWSEPMYQNFVENMATAAICETHSRFYENIIGRSKTFTKLILKDLQETLGNELNEYTAEDVYRAVNFVKPDFIRTEADEFTYSLHIIIRYEIERDLINGVIECEDIPTLWKQKYKEYLGVDVVNDAQGCMQDIHWSDASIGYFPSYALGNLYGAQILHKMKQELDIDHLIASDQIETINQWFAENDFAYDWKDPNDWLLQVTGEPLNVQYFLDYLREKYLA